MTKCHDDLKKCRKLLAIDLDGTLLTDENNITPLTMEYLLKAQQNNTIVCIVTGREYISALEIVNRYSLNFPLACYNGAQILDVGNKKEYYYKPIDKDPALKIVDFCLRERLVLHIIGKSGWFVTGINDLVIRFSKYINREPSIIKDIKEIEDMDITKLVGVDSIEKVEEFIRTNKLRVNYVNSDPYSIDVVAEGVSKGNAVKILGSILAIDKEQIISVGNYYNDVDMFKVSNVGIAVKNAPEAVKKQADYVTGSNNEEWVKEVIEKFVLTAC